MKLKARITIRRLFLTICGTMFSMSLARAEEATQTNQFVDRVKQLHATFASEGNAAPKPPTLTLRDSWANGDGAWGNQDGSGWANAWDNDGTGAWANAWNNDGGWANAWANG